jgi:hypothetical protein
LLGEYANVVVVGAGVLGMPLATRTQLKLSTLLLPAELTHCVLPAPVPPAQPAHVRHSPLRHWSFAMHWHGVVAEHVEATLQGLGHWFAHEPEPCVATSPTGQL